MPANAPRQMIGLLLCLGISPVAAQDNPWRVPGNPTDGWFGSGNAPQPYGGQTGNWAGSGTAHGQAGTYSGGQGWTPPPRNEPAWDNAPARRSGDSGGYAALPPDRLQRGVPGQRSMTDTYTSPYSSDTGAARSQPRQDAPRYGGFPSDRHLEAPGNGAQQGPPQQPRIMLGEFPPLEGERRLPSSERLEPPRREPPPEGEWRARPAPSYGDSYGPAYSERYGERPVQPYGRDGGYRNGQPDPRGAGPYYAPRDPLLSGPSTLTNPWGTGAYGGYATPYGMPGPYGW